MLIGNYVNWDLKKKKKRIDEKDKLTAANQKVGCLPAEYMSYSGKPIHIPID